MKRKYTTVLSTQGGEAGILEVGKKQTQQSAQRLLEDGVEKVKRFAKEDLRNFSVVDQDAKRWKYNKKEIHNLQLNISTNRYYGDSPNQKRNH